MAKDLKMSNRKPISCENIFSVNLSMSLLLISAVALGGVDRALASSEPEFPAGQSCAAWKTKKRMFLVRTVEPVGISCEVKVERSLLEGVWALRIWIPVASFNSGEAERDAEVLKLLKGERYPDILISTEKLEPQLVEDFYKGIEIQVPGRIEVGGKSLERKFSVRKGNQGLARVSLLTRFKDFDLKPPQVAGGMIAQVRDDLELHAQIQIPQEVAK